MKEGGMFLLVAEALPMNWGGPAGFKGLMTQTHENTVPGPQPDEYELPKIAVHHCVPTIKIMAELTAIASVALLIEISLPKMAAFGKRLYAKVKPGGAVELEHETGEKFFYRRKPLSVEGSLEQVPGVGIEDSLPSVSSEDQAPGVSSRNPTRIVRIENPAPGDPNEEFSTELTPDVKQEQVTSSTWKKPAFRRSKTASLALSRAPK